VASFVLLSFGLKLELLVSKLKAIQYISKSENGKFSPFGFICCKKWLGQDFNENPRYFSPEAFLVPDCID